MTGRAQLKHEARRILGRMVCDFFQRLGRLARRSAGQILSDFLSSLCQKAFTFRLSIICRSGKQFTKFRAKRRCMVTEKGTATAIAADGEIPYQLNAERTQQLRRSCRAKAMLSARLITAKIRRGLFVGQQVSLDEIGLADAKSADRASRSASPSAR